MKRLAWNAVAVLAAAVLAGCQPATPTPPSSTTPVQSPTSVPTPTYLCTPEAGGDEAPCSEIEYEEMKAKDALYAEAEAVYRKLFAENIRISRAGGAVEPTSTVLETTEGAFRENIMSIFRGLKEDNLHARGEDPSVVIGRAPGVSKQGSVVALKVCVDATGWAFYAADNLVSQGRVGLDIVHFSRFEQALKIIGADGEYVESC